MQTITDDKPKAVYRVKATSWLSIAVTGFRTLQIPGVDGARLGTCFVRVTDLPIGLDAFMAINPRVPSRTKVGLLRGPVAQGILSTLREQPHEMVIKNQGIYVLAAETKFAVNADVGKGGAGTLELKLADKGKHGIVNGGHTYAAIREAIETATPEELESLKEAYVRLNVYVGVDEEFVPEMAEGLNRSKQVDDPSLVNLQGDFDAIRKALKGIPGASEIAYHQGDSGSIYISEILVYLEMFNVHRFSSRKHPNALYNRAALGLKYFSQDMQEDEVLLQALIGLLPDILWLADSIRSMVPRASNRNSLKFGRIKLGTERAGTPKATKVQLPFISSESAYRVPNGWTYPMLAAFRANLALGVDGELAWRMPLKELLGLTIDELVGVCVVELRDNNMRPELIGKRESAYSTCYAKVELVLAKAGLLQ